LANQSFYSHFTVTVVENLILVVVYTIIFYSLSY